MNRTKLTRIALIACSFALACMTMVMGVTYALLSEKVTVKNHLNAGGLNVTLVRERLDYRVLDNTTGEFVQTEIIDKTTLSRGMDFSEPTDEGIFGLDDYEDITVAPGAYFAATMALYNDGDIAFDYEIELELLGEGDPNELAKQLKVTVSYPESPNREPQVKMLSELKGEGKSLVIDTGHMAKGENQQAFTVRVEFIPDGDSNKTTGQSVEFDLTVNAVQTERTSNP